jgi:hypothetical protein
MRRVIIYPGFHKTGTTSAQKALAENAEVLSPYVDIYLRDDIISLCETARAASADMTEERLDDFSIAVDALAEYLLQSGSKKVLLASEDLSGHMPGRQGVNSYATAVPTLMKILSDGLEEFELTFFFSTRKSDAWLASCYAQHVQYTRIEISREEYAEMFAASADLDAVVAEIRAAIPNDVRAVPLESVAKSPFGPLTPVLDVLELTRAQRKDIAVPKHFNASPPPEMLDQMLALNRSDLRMPNLREAKRNLRRQLRADRQNAKTDG